MLEIRRLDASDPGFAAALAKLIARDQAQDDAIDASVASIIADVRLRGDAAVLEYTGLFDRVKAKTVAALELPAAELEAAHEALPADQKKALAQAAERIRAYHSRQGAESWSFTEKDGTRLGLRVTPLERVGVYVPGGKAAYPSSVLMNVLPAKVAGVPQIVMVVPTPNGIKNALVLAARRPSRRWPMARRRSRRSTRSSGQATPTSRRRSGESSGPSASTWLRDRRKCW